MFEDQLRIKGFLFLNNVLDILGYRLTSVGYRYGWTDKFCMEVDIVQSDDRKNYVIAFECDDISEKAFNRQNDAADALINTIKNEKENETMECNKKLNTLKAGDHFTFKGYDWIVLDPDYHEPVSSSYEAYRSFMNGNKGVLAIMASTWRGKEYQFDTSNDHRDRNNYAKSTLRKEILKLVDELGDKNLRSHKVDLVADNGDDSYGSVTDKVFILSCDEYRKYRKNVPLLSEWMWTCTPWYCLHPEEDAGYARYVRYVHTDGTLSDSYASISFGVAPACVFNPDNLTIYREAVLVKEVDEQEDDD